MKARVWLLGTVAAVAALVAGPTAARADDPPAKPGGPFVVIVGAGEYLDKAIHARPTADADARAFYDLVTDPKYLGVPADRVKLYLSKPDDKRQAAIATRPSIVTAVTAAVANTRKDDLIILAFFGRATSGSSADKTCFLTSDCTFKERAKTGLVFGTDLEPVLQKAEGRKVLMVLDLVYKGFDAKGENVAEPELTDIMTMMFGPEYKQESARPVDRLLITNIFASNEPLARGEHSLFAAALIDALKGAADKAPYNEGYESDGLITTDELTAYLDKEVADQADKLGKDEKEKLQRAGYTGKGSSHFIVTRNPAETAKVQKRVEALAALAKKGTVPEEMAKEGASLLNRMPRLKAYQELRKSYQKLADGDLTVDDVVATRKEIKDGLKLPAKVADAYTRKVEAAISVVTDNYIREVTGGELAAAAIRGMYRRVNEALPSELEEALKNPKTLTDEKRVELLKDARLRLGQREDLAGDKDADLSIMMMLSSLADPHTVYWDRDEFQRVASSFRGLLTGVGIQIRRDAGRDGLLVISPIKGGPAFEAGIQAGDLITEIRREVDPEGNPLPADAPKVISTKGMKADDAVKLILGTPGTPVTLVVQREGEKEPKVFALKRKAVPLETVVGYERDTNNDWKFMIDEKNKVGYIRLTGFVDYDAREVARFQHLKGKGTHEELAKAIAALKKEGMKSLILDLRYNGGGYLTSAEKICEMFVGREKIVSIKPRAGSDAGPSETYRGKIAGDKSYKLVVLVNDQSASASEIVAACLQDHERAVVIGEKSYGKGSVQQMKPFSATGGVIKLTIARYYPPSDRNIDKHATEADPSIKDWGVTPDKGFEQKLTREESADLYELLHDLEKIPASAADRKMLTEEKDRQLKFTLDYLRKEGGNKGASK